jgi:hypothetical protein
MAKPKLLTFPMGSLTKKPTELNKNHLNPVYIFMIYFSKLIFSLLSLFWNKKFWEELIAYFPRHDIERIENDASSNSSIVACVFVAAVTFLVSSCLVKVGVRI